MPPCSKVSLINEPHKHASLVSLINKPHNYALLLNVAQGISPPGVEGTTPRSHRLQSSIFLWLNPAAFRRASPECPDRIPWIYRPLADCTGYPRSRQATFTSRGGIILNSSFNSTSLSAAAVLVPPCVFVSPHWAAAWPCMPSRAASRWTQRLKPGARQLKDISSTCKSSNLPPPGE